MQEALARPWEAEPLANTYSFKSLMDFRQDSRIIEPVDGDFNDYRLNGQLREFVTKELSAIDALGLMISGSDYLTLCISNWREPFDFELPDSELEVDERVRVVPYSEVRLRLQHATRHVLLGIEALAVISPVPLLALEPPPPIASNEFIAANAGWASNLVGSGGVSPPTLRLKFWLLQSALIREACAQAGVPYLRLPSELLEPPSYLPTWAYGHDLMHANSVYGGRVLQSWDSESWGDY